MTNPSADNINRRQALRVSVLGGAAAAFLAACGKAIEEGGQSGTPVATTLVAPTVPTTKPSAVALDQDQTNLRTGSSLELLAAEVYTTYGPKLADPAWETAAGRFAADHTANAEIFAADSEKPADEPNAFLRDHLVTPVEELLQDDAAILNLFRDIESTLVATYVTAAGTFTSAEWRAQVAGFAAGSARRVGVLGNGGLGQGPDSATYPLVDLIPNAAYELNTPTTTAPAG